MCQPQINFDDQGIFHKLDESFNLRLLGAVLILVNACFLNLCYGLGTVPLEKNFLHVLRQLGVVAEKAPDEVVSEELVKVNHLDKVYIHI